MVISRHVPSPTVLVVPPYLLMVCVLALLVPIAPAVPIAIMLTPVAALVAWRAPGVVLALYLGLPIYKGALDPMLPVDPTLVLALLSGVAALPVLPTLVARRRVLVPWLLLAALIVVGGLRAPGGIAIAGAFLVLVTGAGLAGLRVAPDARARRQFIGTLVAIGTVSIVATFAALDGTEGLRRASALGVNPIATARAAMIVPLAGLPWLWPRRSLRPLLVAAVPVAAVAAVATGSRGPVVLAGVTAALVWLASGRGGRRAVRLVPVLGGAVLVATLPVSSLLGGIVPAVALARIASLGGIVRAALGGGDAVGSDQARLRLWALAVRMWETAPALGHGAGSFAEATPAIGMPDIAYPHNLLLQAGAEYGLLGLVVVGGIVVATLRRALRPQADGAATAIATLAVYLLLNAMVSDDLTANRMLWGTVLLVLALPRAHPAPPAPSGS